jgi:hypothetical protein
MKPIQANKKIPDDKKRITMRDDMKMIEKHVPESQ